MPKSLDDKIDEIHDAVITMAIEFKSFKSACAVRHEAVNKDIECVSEEIYGNGRPGLIDKHHGLSARFDKFETRIAMVTAGVVLIFQFVGPKIVKSLGW